MSTIKTNIIEPLGTAITISGAAHFTSGNAVLGGLTATGTINANGGLSVTGGATVYGDIEVYNGAFVRSGGLSVTGSASISQNMTVGSNLTVGSNMTVGGSATASTAFSAPNTPKAWAIIQNGTTLVAGYNVSSVSSNQGRVYINFPAGVFPDANWCVVAISAINDSNEIVRPVGVGNTRTATQCELYCTGIGSSSTLTQNLAASPHLLVYAVFYHL